MNGHSYRGMLEILARELTRRGLRTEPDESRLRVFGRTGTLDVWIGAYSGSMAFFWGDVDERIVPVAQIHIAAQQISEQVDHPFGYSPRR